MKEKKDDIIYTAEDIKRYITGGMSPVEMHAIEMAALDDPLLAEAMEGYELMEQKDWGNELAGLKQQFNKQAETRVIPITKQTSFKWWKAVAAIFVLGATATTAYIFTNKNKTEAAQEIAKIETAPVTEQSTTVAATDSANVLLNEQTAGTGKQLIAKLDQDKTKGFSATTVENNGTVSATVAQPAADSVSQSNTTQQGDYAINKKATDDINLTKKESRAVKDAAPSSAAGNSDVALNEKEHDKNIMSRDEKARHGNSFAIQNSFNGQVLTPDNKPVSYAQIAVPQNKKPVYTDANGRFAFNAADTTVNVTVSSVGYRLQKFTLQNSAPQNKLVLQPQDIAMETVSVTSGKKKSVAKPPQPVIDSSSLEAEPSIGWAEYNNYLNDNLQLPETAKQNNIHGEVEVNVKLKDNGDISTVKVAKPLCPECDAEAVRLVKEGPKWDVKSNKKARAKVKVKF